MGGTGRAKKKKEILRTTLSQEIKQLRQNGQLLRKTQIIKSDSKRNRADL